MGLCTLIACEVAARLLFGTSFVSGERVGATWKVVARFDPNLGWANESGARGNIESSRLNYHASINSLGFRDPARVITKRAGVRRVLFLGDSVTWGWGVNDGERFCDLLDAELRPKLEVIDAAVPGYGTDQELWTLEARGDALQPDLVVLVFILNDVLDCDESLRYEMAKPRFVPVRDTWSIEGRPVPDPRGMLRRWLGPTMAELGAHSALWTALQRWRQREDPLPAPDEKMRPYRPQYAARILAVADKLLEPDSPARHALTLMRAWCARRKVPFAVIVLPHNNDPYLYEPLCERPEFDGTTAFTKVVERVGADLDIPVKNVDALMFAQAVKGHRLHCGDGHLNVDGNALVARALQPMIEGWLASH